MTILVACMGIMIAAWVSLAVTVPIAGQSPPNPLRRIAVLTWSIVISVGWAAFGFITLSSGATLDRLWMWSETQPLVSQAAMWVFLLPWMLALWIWQMPWTELSRMLVIACFALITLLLAVRQN